VFPCPHYSNSSLSAAHGHMVSDIPSISPHPFGAASLLPNPWLGNIILLPRRCVRVLQRRLGTDTKHSRQQKEDLDTLCACVCVCVCFFFFPLLSLLRFVGLTFFLIILLFLLDPSFAPPGVPHRSLSAT
jgi:hypothetical protein